MKKISLALSLLLTAVSAFAQNNTIVRWHQITGVITAPGVDNPVAGAVISNGIVSDQIHSGTLPWTTKGGSAHVNLATGEGAFDVEGLVLNGGSSTGTPGTVTSVMGTLICNPGIPGQATMDTPTVDLSTKGNAELSFKLNVPVGCANPLFLIRVPAGRWIAAGAVRVIGGTSGN